MHPVITILGRPNVGKSTLFNRLTKTRAAIVHDEPGVTRDRHHGVAQIEGNPVILVDTAGWSSENDSLQTQLNAQAEAALTEADLILFMTDAAQGLLPEDGQLVSLLRAQSLPVLLVSNKIDCKNAQYALGEFFALGLGEPLGLSSTSGRGIVALRTAILDKLNLKPIVEEPTDPDDALFEVLDADPEVDPVIPEHTPEPKEDQPIKLALIGRPNVGKSTLLNYLAGEERMLVSDQAGTTRDAVSHDIARGKRKLTVIDTAGLRRQSKINENVERFAALRTLQALSEADVCILLFNSADPITEQDSRLLGLAIQMGVPICIGLNQWDRLDKAARKACKHTLERKLQFADYIEQIELSALKGRGVQQLVNAAYRAHRASQTDLSTSSLIRTLERAIEAHQPPVMGTRRIKLRFANLAGRRPITIRVSGKQATKLPIHYQRYLSNTFRKHYKLVGVPVHITLKDDDNPFKKDEQQAR